MLSFKLALNNPSRLAELQELEHWKSRFDAADAATNSNYFSRRWVSKNILSVNEEEFERMQSEMFYDRKHDFLLEQVGEALASDSAGGLGGLGDDAGPPADTGLETPEEPPPVADEQDSPLLATPGAPAAEPAPPAGEAPETPPGKRDVKDQYGRKYTTTAASKHKYHPVTNSDGRDGAMQSFLAQGGNRHVGTSKKSVFPGAHDISSIYKLTEADQQSNYYDEQEKEILQENKELKNLIDSLQSLEDIKNETKT